MISDGFRLHHRFRAAVTSSRSTRTPFSNLARSGPDAAVSHGQRQRLESRGRVPSRGIFAGQQQALWACAGDSQAQSASSLLVTRSTQEPGPTDRGFLVVWTGLSVAINSLASSAQTVRRDAGRTSPGLFRNCHRSVRTSHNNPTGQAPDPRDLAADGSCTTSPSPSKGFAGSPTVARPQDDDVYSRDGTWGAWWATSGPRRAEPIRDE